MKKLQEKTEKKEKILENIGEAVLEIVLSVSCFGIGALILLALGIRFDEQGWDGDAVVLLGIGALVVIGLAIGAVTAVVQKKKKKAQKETEQEGEK